MKRVSAVPRHGAELAPCGTMSAWRGTSTLLVAGMTLAACGRSASAPSAAVANFQGEFAGAYVINSCSETGVFFSGFCFGSGSNAGGTFPLEVSFSQSQAAVSGTVVLSRADGTPIRGPFQGTVQPSGHLTGSATLPSVPLTGTVLFARNIATWDTTIAGASLNGGFSLVYSSPTEAGTMTVSATLVQMTRR